MSGVLELRGGNTSFVVAITPLTRELLINTDDGSIRVGDGSTVGGLVSTSPITVADVWFSLGTALDLSNPAVVAKFLNTSNGTPVDLGNNGEIPTGSQPTLYLHITGTETNGNNFGINLGSGGTLTRIGATIPIASPTPKIGT